MNPFIQRTAFGALYAGLWIGTLLSHSIINAVFLALASLVVTKEFFYLFKTIGIWRFVTICGLSFLLFQTDVPFIYLAYASALTQMGMAYCMFTQKNIKRNNTLTMGISGLHICIPIMLLLHYNSVNSILNRDLVLGLLFLVWTTDSVAFVFGSWLGKHPLYTKISPNKTVEGALAACFFTPLVAYGIAQYSDALPSSHWIFLGMLVSLLSIIGDLTQSHIKRIAHVKDSGKILPGHGGLYDRMDSLIFATPFVYVVLFYIL